MQRHRLTGVEQKVLAVEGDDFRDARPGVVKQLKQEPIPPATEGIRRRGFQDGLDLRGRQIAQQWPRLSFVGDGQNPACQRQELGFSLSHKPHEAVDGGQPGIAAAGTAVALLFQMFQEGQNVWRVPILQSLL